MKSKLLTFLIIVAVMLPFFASPALAAKVVDITSPGGNDLVVTKEIFSICGICIYDDTTIEFQYKDKDTEKYEELLTTDGEANFKVGSSRLFGKSVELKYKGKNEIRIIAYTKATKNDPQESDYTITFSSEEKNKGNWFSGAWNWFAGANEKK